MLGPRICEYLTANRKMRRVLTCLSKRSRAPMDFNTPLITIVASTWVSINAIPRKAAANLFSSFPRQLTRFGSVEGDVWCLRLTTTLVKPYDLLPHILILSPLVSGQPCPGYINGRDWRLERYLLRSTLFRAHHHAGTTPCNFQYLLAQLLMSVWMQSWIGEFSYATRPPPTGKY